MVVGGEVFQAGLWSKQALERMLREGMPPTPRNYHVYYEYISGRNFALSNAIDQVIARDARLSQHHCDEFYYKYIVSDEGQSLSAVDAAINKELEKVLDLIAGSAKETGQFGETLSSFSGELKSSSSTETLREAVRKIAEETQIMAARNEKLQKELSETSEQLNVVRDDFARARHEAQIDALTEIGNRKFFDREIVRTLSEAVEQGLPLCLLMIDIDHFKKFNDTHGHLVGDQVLRLVARTLVENLKGRDIIARYGGEEFVIILPETRLVDAERVANHLRNSLATKKVTKRGTNEVLGVITISIGASEYKPGEDGDTLISRADEGLYQAKQTGRNKVVCVGP